MKKNITICLGLVIMYIGLQAQNNFQFNRVYNFGAGTNYTVPSGKVLKIESVNFNSPTLIWPFISCSVYSTSFACIYNSSLPLFAIDQNIFLATGENSTVVGNCSVCPSTKQAAPFSSSGINIAVPIWLGEGKSITINGSGVFISALEFNLVP
jgi:hypothetical protein